MSVRFKICLAAWVAVIAWSANNGFVNAQPPIEPVPAGTTLPPATVVSDDWVIDIRPAAKVHPATSPMPTAECDNCSPKFSASDYQKALASIPFDRAQYNVNPTYRHDSAMELLTGNARHQTIVKHSYNTPQPTVIPGGSSYVAPYNPARYGYLRPALRLNYYRHFPSLNPYVNIWNYSGAF